MADTPNYFADAPQDYRQYRPRYPQALFDYLADAAPARAQAWDCGCGNGQATLELAARFAQVTASDLSAEQIAQAPQAGNVTYQVSAAEAIAAPPASVDLVTVAQAIHWFDHERFFAAVDRCLKPGGLLAAWGYQLIYSDSELDGVIARFHGDVLGDCWPKGRELLDEGYSRISFPYPREAAPAFRMQVEWSFSQLLGYLKTWSAVKRFEAAQGFNPVDAQRQALQQAWGEAPSRALYWPLILYVGRKPLHTQA